MEEPDEDDEEEDPEDEEYPEDPVPWSKGNCGADGVELCASAACGKGKSVSANNPADNPQDKPKDNPIHRKLNRPAFLPSIATLCLPILFPVYCIRGKQRQTIELVGDRRPALPAGMGLGVEAIGPADGGWILFISFHSQSLDEPCEPLCFLLCQVHWQLQGGIGTSSQRKR